jgi:hypothetical protein
MHALIKTSVRALAIRKHLVSHTYIYSANATTLARNKKKKWPRCWKLLKYDWWNSFPVQCRIVSSVDDNSTSASKLGENQASAATAEITVLGSKILQRQNVSLSFSPNLAGASVTQPLKNCNNRISTEHHVYLWFVGDLCCSGGGAVLTRI